MRAAYRKYHSIVFGPEWFLRKEGDDENTGIWNWQEYKESIEMLAEIEELLRLSRVIFYKGYGYLETFLDNEVTERRINNTLLIDGEPTSFPKRAEKFVERFKHVTLSSNGQKKSLSQEWKMSLSPLQ